MRDHAHRRLKSMPLLGAALFAGGTIESASLRTSALEET
jgi:hypothetical protein